MRKSYLFILVFGLLATFNQCKSDKTNQNTSTETEFSDTIQHMEFLLPSPDEMLSEIFTEEIELNPVFVNPLENVQKYVDTRYQALNLGIYVADFSYLGFTDNMQKEIDYLNVIKDLSEKVNLYGIMDEKLLTRIQTNLTYSDSLKQISQEMYYELSDVLENTNRNNIFTLISTGTIVESLYLVSMNVKDFKEFEGIITRLFEQKFVFENFYDNAMIYSNDSYVKSILAQLDRLKQSFEQLQKNVTESKVTKTTGNDFKIEGGVEFIITENAFNKFKEEITAIRTEIVNASNN